MATGALTPPDIGVPSRPLNMEEQLGVRLQEALGQNYHVEGTLGSGGFAVVYLVRDLSLKRKLAVKVLSPDLIASKTVLERFRREAETIAQLHHPHIVPLHFIGQKEDLLYLAMECVEGDTLAGRLEKEGQLSPEETARLLREIASALEHAHKRGVIHRDIKPQNVLIETESGRALVTDFGIARTAEGASLTASGMVVGTPQYLSPEQVTGTRPSDHRADIYALGVMGYEMLAGHPPFTGPTPTAVMMKRLAGDPPSLSKSRPDIPQPLLDVIRGCMAMAPEDRFQSAAEVVRALGGATPASGGHPTAEIVLKMRRARRRWTMTVATFAVVVVLVAAWLAWWWSTHSHAQGAAGSASRVDSGMVAIPGGQYAIGRNNGPLNSRPAHPVTLDTFAIDGHEVTVKEFRAYANATRAPLPWTAEPDSLLPVTGVLWAEAAQYCAWRHDGGRLPTEEEWEAAARGPRGLAYPWGNEWDPVAANTSSSARVGPARVGSFPRGATAAGVHDLIGNVWEWTSSRMVPYPGGTAPPEGANSYVIRGGAFNTPDSLANPTQRGYIPLRVDRSALGATGFRCVIPLRQGTR